MQTKLPRLSKHMTNGEKAAIARDFKRTFADVAPEDIDAAGVTEWALNTREIYDWFYTRVERRADELLALGEHFRMFNEYRPAFMEWTPWELMPPMISDFLRGLVREAGHDWLASSSIVNEVSKKLFDYYRTEWRELRQPPFTVITLIFYHGKHSVKRFVNSKRTDEEIRAEFINRKQDDAQREFSRVVKVKIQRFTGKFNF